MTSSAHPATAPVAVAVIGAGVSGLAAAHRLAQAGCRVSVFEKSRGPGGRTATRRQGQDRFDHGAQYFTARDPAFRRQLESWLEDGLVEPWPRRLRRVDADGEWRQVDAGERYAGTRGMNAMARHLARELDVRFGSRVTAVERAGGRWRLLVDAADDATGFGAEGWDALVVSLPAPQAAELLRHTAPRLAQEAAAVAFAPCLAVIAPQRGPGSAGFDAALFEDDVLAWAAADYSKPGRQGGSLWVLHATAGWSETHFDSNPAAVIGSLCERFAARGGPPLRARQAIFHRWRYARVVEPLHDGILVEGALGLTVCGDWCLGESRVENAWLSGIAAAARLIEPGTISP